MVILILFSSFLFLGTVSYAQETEGRTVYIIGDLGWLRLENRDTFKVVLSDQVSGNCFKNKDAIQTSLELELRRSGWDIANEETLFFNTLYFEFVGYRTQNLCVVALNMQIYVSSNNKFTYEESNITSFRSMILYDRVSVLSGPDSDFDFRLKEQSVELLQYFLNIIDVEKNKVIEEIENYATP